MNERKTSAKPYIKIFLEDGYKIVPITSVKAVMELYSTDNTSKYNSRVLMDFHRPNLGCRKNPLGTSLALHHPEEIISAMSLAIEKGNESKKGICLICCFTMQEIEI